MANITPQPVVESIIVPISTPITAGKDALQVVSPIQTPRAVASALPPLTLRKGEIDNV